MPLVERQVIGQITILEDGRMNVRTDTIIERDGVEINRSYHREVLEPGQDIADKHDRVKAAANAYWDADTVRVFNEKKDEAQADAGRPK